MCARVRTCVCVGWLPTQDEFFVTWHKQGTAEIFKAEDKDEDGYLAWVEFNGPKGQVDPTPSLQRNFFVVLDVDQVRARTATTCTTHRERMCSCPSPQ
jgi:hypothetical protein